MNRSILLSFVFLLFASVVIGQTSLEGKVKDGDTGEPAILANVAIYKNGALITGTETDFDGNYVISNIDPGTYDVIVSIVGYSDNQINGVVVFQGKSNKLDVELTSGVTLNEVVVTDYKVPLIEQDNTTQGGTITSEEIRNLPTRNINALASQTAGVATSDEGEALNFRGSRSGGTNYYVDGIRVVGTMVPNTEIDQLQMITGGIEAQFGDVTGGIVSITTKGPSRKFSGGIEMETSSFLDPYNHNLVSANLSGPILKNKEGIPILGYRVSGQWRLQEDDDPIATPHYLLKDELRDELAANPITLFNGSFFPTAEFYTNDDVVAVDSRQFEEFTDLALTAKIDARLSEAIDLSLTGAYTQTDNMFTPSNAWITYNSFNNPTQESSRYRVNLRFRHRFGSGSSANNPDQQASKNALIRNMSYILQAGFERGESSTEDPRHGQNLFNYGYVGSFGFTETPVFGTDVNGNFGHVDYRQDYVEGSYTESPINAGLARYNDLVNQSAFENFNVINGDQDNQFSSIWQLHTNINQVYNSVSKSESDRYTLNAIATFDLFPGGSNAGRHNIQFGFMYEDRVNRQWSMAPYGLYQLARQSANNHITGVDTTIIVDTMTVAGFQDPFPVYARLADDESQISGNFWRAIREVTGQSTNEWVNVDAITPDQMSLDMFAVRELTDQALVNYRGYDYLGNRLSSNPSFEDFWRVISPEGAPVERSFEVGAWQPNYFSVFIQDKFTFRDIIFRLGVRMDRFDANTKILRDPLSFYEIMGAGSFHSLIPTAKPASIGDDYKVYVESSTSTAVKAYRDGNQWYFPDGTPANNGSLIFGGEVVNPYLQNRDQFNQEIDIRDAAFDPNTSFADYEPQVNWMPRLAFSFPISDVANFFAHYDVLVQRPSNVFVSPLTYYYFTEPGRVNVINNADLRPERTIDYAVGFQQKLSNSSAIKINAYYREMRDMIQAVTIPFVPILTQYETFGNEDFGTVKGFTFQYDLRRTNNLQMRIDYTLQFADGTGSNAGSQRGLTTRGNIRALFPLSFEERHRINVNMDYRYGSGKRYNGPVIGGLDILANTGINLQAITFSGRPYTSRPQPEILGGSGFEGSINGARRPWTFTLNLQADKSFVVGENTKYPMNINIYMRVQNLLDERNIVGVYPATGSATDDGFLESSRGEAVLNDIVNTGRAIQPYLDSYNWRLQNPNLFSLPRRMVLGTRIYF